jgi:hypothetical protein
MMSRSFSGHHFFSPDGSGILFYFVGTPLDDFSAKIKKIQRTAGKAPSKKYFKCYCLSFKMRNHFRTFEIQHQN